MRADAMIGAVGPPGLRAAVNVVSDSVLPMMIVWGPESVLFYNESCAPILGERHPSAMGQPMKEAWPEIWPAIEPAVRSVTMGGGAARSEDVALAIERNGRFEERHFTFGFSPIGDEAGVLGALCTIVETTHEIVAERRLRALHALESRSLADAAAQDPIDLPFLRIYLFGTSDDLAVVDASGPSVSDGERWPVKDVAQTKRARVVPSSVDARVVLNKPVRVTEAIVLPLTATGQRSCPGAMVAGLSPLSLLDDDYRRFLELLAARVAAEVTRAPAIEHERVLRMLSDTVPQIICTADATGRMDYFNRRWFEFTGLTESQSFENEAWLEAVHPDERAALESGWHGAARTGSDFSTEIRIRSRFGEYRWFLMRAVAFKDETVSVVRVFGTATDINDCKRIEEREIFLSHVSEVLGSTLEPRTLLQRITELCVPAFADWCQLQTLNADGELVVEAVRHRDPELNKRMEALVGRSVVAMRSDTLGSPQVLRVSESRALDREAALRAVRANVPDPEDRALYEAAGIGSVLIVPLVARGKTRGTLHLVNADPAWHRPQIAREVAEELAHRAAVAIDNSRLYEREHRVASALQHAMLPAYLPAHPRIDLSFAYRPAERESRVGGDWYDAFVISDTRMAISIGDVAGHGLEASIAMNEARHALRLSALEGLSPAQTLRRANAALMLNPDHPLITAIHGVIDVERSTFRYSCAGHPPPAVAPLFGRARYLEGGGMPMGVDLDVAFPSREVQLRPYTTLLLYTDGLIEFDRNIERETERLLEALSGRVHDMSSDGAGALLRFVLNNRQLDDIAVLAATILPAMPAPVEIELPAAPSSASIARRFVSRYARVAQLSPDRSFDLVIAVGEAVANAVEHAYDGSAGLVTLRLDFRGDRVHGEVADVGTWQDREPSKERGRGLSILRATTHRFVLDRSPQGTTVSFDI